MDVDACRTAIRGLRLGQRPPTAIDGSDQTPRARAVALARPRPPPGALAVNYPAQNQPRPPRRAAASAWCHSPAETAPARPRSGERPPAGSRGGSLAHRPAFRRPGRRCPTAPRSDDLPLLYGRAGRFTLCRVANRTAQGLILSDWPRTNASGRMRRSGSAVRQRGAPPTSLSGRVTPRRNHGVPGRALAQGA